MRQAKLAWNRIPRGKKIPKDACIKTVETCDSCGKYLGKKYFRDMRDAISAHMDGLYYRRIGDGLFMFFCSPECRNKK